MMPLHEEFSREDFLRYAVECKRMAGLADTRASYAPPITAAYFSGVLTVCLVAMSAIIRVVQ